MQPYLDGYIWDGDTLKQNPHSGKITPIKRTKVSKKNAENSGGVLHGFLLSNEGYTHRSVEANFWSEFIKILDPFFEAKVHPMNLLETLNTKSHSYDEEITTQVKELILNFVNDYGFDFNNEVWTDDIENRLTSNITKYMHGSIFITFMFSDGYGRCIRRFCNYG